MKSAEKEFGPHWGRWIAARASHLGLMRQADFAGAVGCGVTQLRKWLCLAAPPSRMHKGFDRRLADALKTDRQTLFFDYRHLSPAEVPAIDVAAQPSPERLREELKAMADTVDCRTLRVMLATAHALAEAGVCAA